jgi:hypothetical protein
LWPQVGAWIVANDALDIVRTEFSNAEIESAEWLRMRGEWHHGYPLPREELGYLIATYDLSEYCMECGVGAKQVAPFRMRGEPKWGRRGILQLNWVFGEYFVKPSVWRDVFEPHHIPYRSVIDAKGKNLRRSFNS